MQRVKNMMYATAGVQMVPGIEMNVRSHVFMPDAEAGSENQRSHYRADHVVERRREASLSWNACCVFFAALILVLGLCVGMKYAKLSQLTGEYTANQAEMQQTRLSNLQKSEELAQARDINRIRYLASNNYNMVSAVSVESIPVVAPDTRVANDITNGQTASSPLAGGYGIYTGSR